MTLFALILANLIVMVASAVQTAVGIGFGLIAVPLLALIDIRLIPGPTLFVSLFLALTMTSVGRAAIDRKEMSRIFVGLVIGTVFGGLALAIAPPDYLPDLFGGMILVAVVVSLLGVEVKVSDRNLIASGTAAGMMGTMSGIHGPPLALLYQYDKPDKVRVMIASAFAFGYTISIVALHFTGYFGWVEFKLAIFLFPGLAAGYVLPKLFTGVVPDKSLRTGILVIAGFSALMLNFNG